MATTIANCSQLVKRLKSLAVPFGADKSELERELLKSLVKYCKSDFHAGRVVEQILANFTCMPMPAELKAAAAAVSDAGDIPGGCTLCHGENFVHSERMIGGDIYHFSGRCSCSRGRYLAAKDRENEARAKA